MKELDYFRFNNDVYKHTCLEKIKHVHIIGQLIGFES